MRHFFLVLALLMATAVACSAINVGYASVEINVPSTIPQAVIGQTYTLQLSAAGGNGTYTYSQTSGTMPPGLSLSASTGLISGTPTTVGSYAPYFKACDTEATPSCSTPVQVDPEVVAEKGAFNVGSTAFSISSIGPSDIQVSEPFEIYGSGFVPGMTVGITGAVPCAQNCGPYSSLTPLTITDNEIDGTWPWEAAGQPYNVTVTTADGSQSVTVDPVVGPKETSAPKASGAVSKSALGRVVRYKEGK